MLKRFDLSNYRTRLVVLIILMLGIILSMIFVFVQSKKSTPDPEPLPPTTTTSVIQSEVLVEPSLQATPLLAGLKNVWELGFLPDNTLIFTERSGTLSKVAGDKKQVVSRINDVYVAGEGGLTGMAVDPQFAQNRYIYLCFNIATDVRVARFVLNSDASALGERKDIVTGIPSNRSGRHSGCRLAMGKDGVLWVGTGDAAIASTPQDPQSLGGKILRVDRDGMPTSGNLPAPFDPRIFSYGHRNTQGIILNDAPVDGVYGLSVEHGSDRDDEINLLKTGNFGWAPKVTYVESGIPMTDLARFPDAVSAIWSSGSPTIAPSGATRLTGKQWGAWNGALALAVLKGEQVRIFTVDDTYKVTSEKAMLGEFGRVRTAVQGPDGNLYISTDNGSNDKIVKITPSQP